MNCRRPFRGFGCHQCSAEKNPSQTHHSMSFVGVFLQLTFLDNLFSMTTLQVFPINNIGFISHVLLPSIQQTFFFPQFNKRFISHVFLNSIKQTFHLARLSSPNSTNFFLLSIHKRFHSHVLLPSIQQTFVSSRTFFFSQINKRFISHVFLLSIQQTFLLTQFNKRSIPHVFLHSIRLDCISHDDLMHPNNMLLQIALMCFSLLNST